MPSFRLRTVPFLLLAGVFVHSLAACGVNEAGLDEGCDWHTCKAGLYCDEGGSFTCKRSPAHDAPSEPPPSTSEPTTDAGTDDVDGGADR